MVSTQSLLTFQLQRSEYSRRPTCTKSAAGSRGSSAAPPSPSQAWSEVSPGSCAMKTNGPQVCADMGRSPMSAALKPWMPFNLVALRNLPCRSAQQLLL